MLNAYILLDRTGSMSSRWDETLSSINAYAKELKRAKITVAAFDHNVGFQFDVLRDAVPSGKWKNITDKDATPRGMTPLYDAIGRMVSLAEKNDKKKSIIVVMTDGYENMSREVTKEQAKAALDRCRNRDWQVVFLGADFDAMAQAASVGGAAGQTLNMSAGNYGDTMRGLAAKSSLYAEAGASVSFSDADRKKATLKKLKL